MWQIANAGQYAPRGETADNLLVRAADHGSPDGNFELAERRWREYQQVPEHRSISALRKIEHKYSVAGRAGHPEGYAEAKRIADLIYNLPSQRMARGKEIARQRRQQMERSGRCSACSGSGDASRVVTRTTTGGLYLGSTRYTVDCTRCGGTGKPPGY